MPSDQRRRRPPADAALPCPVASQLLLRQREKYNTEFYCIENAGRGRMKWCWLYCSKRAEEWNYWREGAETQEIVVEPPTGEEQEPWPLNLWPNHTGGPMSRQSDTDGTRRAWSASGKCKIWIERRLEKQINLDDGRQSERRLLIGRCMITMRGLIALGLNLTILDFKDY